MKSRKEKHKRWTFPDTITPRSPSYLISLSLQHPLLRKDSFIDIPPNNIYEVRKALVVLSKGQVKWPEPEGLLRTLEVLNLSLVLKGSLRKKIETFLLAHKELGLTHNLSYLSTQWPKLSTVTPGSLYHIWINPQCPASQVWGLN